MDILASFGAEITRLGRIEGFVAVDTEALSDTVFRPLEGWVRQHRLDAIASTDGDADRPLLMDGAGRFVRGDVLGLLTAMFIEADNVVTPVTSNNAIEAIGNFGSCASHPGGVALCHRNYGRRNPSRRQRVIGFEANGGTLLGSALTSGPKLEHLMTRDAVLPLLGALGLAARQNKPVDNLVDGLPLRAALSDRLENVRQTQSATFLNQLRKPEFSTAYFRPQTVARTADIDGVQFWLESGTMIHYRASGNAPELRCYVEADNESDARDALEWGMHAALHAVRKTGA